MRRLRSSTVEQATHNRQATGSNPVGATLLIRTENEASMFERVSLLGGTLRRSITFAAAVAVFAASGGPVAGEEQQPALRGLAEFESVSARVAEIRPYVLKVCRGHNMQCILIHVKNAGSKIITVDGDNAKMTVGAAAMVPRNVTQLEKATCCRLSTPAIAAVTALSLGTLGLASSIPYEWFANKRDAHFRNGGYGWLKDGPRHEIEGMRFGKRVILQGDESDGWLCFATTEVKPTDNLQIPVTAGDKSGLLEVQIGVPAQATTTNPPAGAATNQNAAPGSHQ